MFTYSYDSYGRLKAVTDVHNKTITTYSYGVDGNLETVNAAGSRTTYSWDYENRMESVILPSGDRHTFAYDPKGKRIETKSPSDVTKFTWDLENVLAEFNNGGSTNRVYTHEPAQYGNLLSHKTSTDNLYYHFDALGSTRLTSNASAVASLPFIYAAFGDTITAPTTPGTPYQWVGQLGYQFDPETLLNYIRARYYDPGNGMWMSEDPLGIHAGINLYQYTMLNPLRFVDPSGMITLCDALTHPCWGNVIGCLCFLVALADISLNWAVILGPVYAGIINALDCFCDILDTITMYCFCDGGNLSLSQYAATIVISFFSCALDFWGTLSDFFEPGIGGLITILERILEAIEQGLDGVLGDILGTEGVSGPSLCMNAYNNCF